MAFSEKKGGKTQKTDRHKDRKETNDGWVQAFEAHCLRKFIRISSLEHKTNDLVRSERQKLTYFGYATRHDSLSKTVLQGTLQCGRHPGRQRKCWMDNVKEWFSLSNG